MKLYALQFIFAWTLASINLIKIVYKNKRLCNGQTLSVSWVQNIRFRRPDNTILSSFSWVSFRPATKNINPTLHTEQKPFLILFKWLAVGLFYHFFFLFFIIPLRDVLGLIACNMRLTNNGPIKMCIAHLVNHVRWELNDIVLRFISEWLLRFFSRSLTSWNTRNSEVK